MSGRLTDGFRDIIEMRWDEFVRLENSTSATNFDAVICSIARGASKGNLRSIQASLDRLDGKIATEIDVEYPKFYTLYPRATSVDTSTPLISAPKVPTSTPPPIPIKPEDEELPTGSIRAVLDRMLDAPKSIVDEILTASTQIDEGSLAYGNPLVKSVIVAGLMRLVHKGKIGAVFEVFDQIDGKVADTYKMLGDDVYMTNYGAIAPAGATLNENGVYQIVNDNVTNSWVMRLEDRENAKKNR